MLTIFALGSPWTEVNRLWPSGLSANFADDHAMLEHGLTMYDAFYAWCRSCQDEKHNWTPAAA